MAGALKFWNGEEDIIIGGSGGGALGVEAVKTENIANKAVSRAKLAQDAFYNPIRYITEDRELNISDLGYQLVISQPVTLTVSAEALSSYPLGAAIPIVVWSTNGADVTFTGNIQVAHLDGNIKLASIDSATVHLPCFDMIAIQKLGSAACLVNGYVEVL